VTHLLRKLLRALGCLTLRYPAPTWRG
jgi:hypothetical protein